MGDWHQDLVVKNATDEELDGIIEDVIKYLLNTKIIRESNADNQPRSELGYSPGEYWDFAVEDPEEDHFLEWLNNGVEIIKGRTVFYADGREFDCIACPSCGENNLGCDWGELFGVWIENPNSAYLECKKCKMSAAICEFKFEPKWELSNLGFVFWNWPMPSNSFIATLEEIISKRIEKVEGKL